ncbi:actin filament network formation [Mactra antiquata]
MLKWTKKNSKSMSGSYSMKGTPAGGGTGVKKGSLSSNGNGPPPLSYPADPPDDENMNEIIDENVDLTVVLPDGSQKHQTIEPNIPMMDLLINLAAANKLNPAGHTLVVLTGDKWKQIDFKANKTIGLLAGEDRQVSVQIVKKKIEDKVKTKTATQPFEMTYRFTVNLPHNQKKVLRISPKLTLGEVRQMLCKEKNFDQSRYVFLLPGNTTDSIDDTTTVGDLKSSEINFVSVAMIEAASSKSMPDLAFAAARANNETKDKKDESGYMPGVSEKKAKRGFLSFLGKKDKKFKVQQDIDTDANARGRPKKSESFNVGVTKNVENQRPVTMYADSGELDHFGLRRTTGDLHQYSDKSEFRKSTGSSLVPVNENVALSTKSDNLQQGSSAPVSQNNKLSESTGAPPKKSAKKRAAPLPPQLNKSQKPKTVQVEIDVHSQSTDQTRIENLPNERVHLKKVHSRNSSDSSGYHELTVSGAESPDANKGDNLQTTLDTTSIDSVDQFNGDSGIRVSPVNRRSASKVAASSRDSSIDIDKPSGRKKKRAPLPPPGMTVTSVVSNRPPSPKQETLDSNVDQAEEFAALQAMEEVTMKFNIEDSEDDDLQMVETSSVHSEDIDIDAPHRQQPPTFIAPPPPSEPPPDDTEPVDLNMVVNRVDTIDIGVGEDTTSLGPESVKSSPITISSRRHSISSNSSVNTIEDLSLDFRQAIEVGEEALGLESDNDSVQEELTKAMPAFKEQISKLANEESNEDLSARSKNSEKEVDSDDSFIEHDDGNDKDNERGTDNYLASLRSVEGNRESAEITYDFKVESVPADFQSNEKDISESDESLVIEEVEILPAAPGILQLESPRSIPDLDSPKEHRSLSLPMSDLQDEIPLEESTPKISSGGRSVTMETEEVVPEKSKEKEEFVISLDELSNVDFSATLPDDQQKKVRRRSTDAPKVNYRIEFRSSRDFDDDFIVEAVPATVIESEPVFHNDNVDDDGIKTKCSELSFSPENEHEDEHLMEEKSISMIALPAERTPVKNSQNTDDGAPTDSFTSSTQITLSPTSPKTPSNYSVDSSPRKDDSFDSNSLMQAQYNQLQQQFSMWQNQLIQNQKLLATQGSPDISSANQMAVKDDQSNLQLQQLQLQIQMQQQMMLQLQQSMQALALQNTLANQQQTFSQPISQPVVTMETSQSQNASPPPRTQVAKEIENSQPEPTIKSSTVGQTFSPPPAPAAPPVAPPAPTVSANKPKPSKADAKYTKPKQRKIERQLDPREQLMLDIRNFGKTHLNKVPVKATHWHK